MGSELSIYEDMDYYKSNLIKLRMKRSHIMTLIKSITLRRSAAYGHTVIPPCSLIIGTSLRLDIEECESGTIIFRTILLSLGQSIWRPSSF